jgi:predicted lipoprotein
MADQAGGRSRTVRRLAPPLVLVALLVAMFLDTKFLSPKEAAALNPAAFSAGAYVEKSWPDVVATLTEKGTDIATLAPAIDKDPAVAGKRYGVDVGSGTFAFPVKATGTVGEVDKDFMVVKIPGVPERDTVRLPLGAAITGTPVRDATGSMTFSDFEGQTDFQSVANQLKITMVKDVVGPLKPATLKGKRVSIVGAYSTGGPPNSFIIQPVSGEVP